MPAKEGRSAITRRSVLKATSAGAAGAAGLVVSTGTVAAHCDDPNCEECVEIGKIEDEQIDNLQEGDTFCFEYETDDICIEVTNIEREDGEPVCVDIETRPDLQESEIGHALCRVNVAAGGETEVYGCEDISYNDNCISSAEDLCAPEHSNPNRDRFGISHITFYVCDFNGDEPGLGGTCST